MKKIALAVLIAGVVAVPLRSLGAAKPVSSRFDPRNQTIAYNPYDTTVINSATGYISTLVFDDDEKVIETKVGFEQGWDVTSSDNRVYIRIKPVSQNVEQVNSEGETETKQVAFGVIGSRKGTSPLRSHGTGRDSLPSSGSCH
ncbi:TrbG/VirB9 family P-type conjugative transfer protein [Escherichia coli]|uniref:TrbG/VirB9 family P-type conjugative transfer protein n=1 Tax=Escherichia coli TaxID=562 RepID=UPI00201AE3A9|nr:TrbG/VirB9 family P-type conjugative transfer protein [Escherichia coli]